MKKDSFLKIQKISTVDRQCFINNLKENNKKKNEKARRVKKIRDDSEEFPIICSRFTSNVNRINSLVANTLMKEIEKRRDLRKNKQLILSLYSNKVNNDDEVENENEKIRKIKSLSKNQDTSLLKDNVVYFLNNSQINKYYMNIDSNCSYNSKLWRRKKNEEVIKESNTLLEKLKKEEEENKRKEINNEEWKLKIRRMTERRLLHVNSQIEVNDNSISQLHKNNYTNNESSVNEHTQDVGIYKRIDNKKPNQKHMKIHDYDEKNIKNDIYNNKRDIAKELKVAIKEKQIEVENIKRRILFQNPSRKQLNVLDKSIFSEKSSNSIQKKRKIKEKVVVEGRTYKNYYLKENLIVNNCTLIDKTKYNSNNKDSDKMIERVYGELKKNYSLLIK